MDYKVLSRKYRPQNFDEIIGQPHVVNTLINSINLNRLAHGYLFSGVRGVGKTTTARVLASTVNNVESCQDTLDVIELDGASNRGIDEIREIFHNHPINVDALPPSGIVNEKDLRRFLQDERGFSDARLKRALDRMKGVGRLRESGQSSLFDF